MEDLEARLLLTTDLTASLAYQRADLDRSGTIDAADIDGWPLADALHGRLVQPAICEQTAHRYPLSERRGLSA